jgi:hypothetical protein
MNPLSTQALCREALVQAPAWEAALHLHRAWRLGTLGEVAATLTPQENLTPCPPT